ncbi:MAG: fasciclin domain-containing protein [Pseudomonadota bacterium]
MNIVEIAAGSDDFNILVQALTTANLVQTIQESNDITVFAPTDAAFTTLAVDLGFTGDQTDETAVFNFIAGALAGLDPNGDPIPLLTTILTYHVSGSVLDSTAVTNAAFVPTLAGAGFDITPNVPVLVDLEPDIINPSLVLDAIDIAADNGIIHTIDRVLLPIDIPGNDVPSITGLVAASGDGPDQDNTDFDLLLAAVQTAGLADTLDTPGLDATVFAPNDAAFIALANDLGFTGTDEAGALTAIVDALTAFGSGNPKTLLTAILTYHVSPGAAQLSQVAGLTEVATLQGGSIGIDGTTLVDAEPDIADPTLIATDIQTSNGIVHVIDRVLIPANIPGTNGLNDVRIELGDAAGGRLRGADDNDLLVGGTARDDMRGLAGSDAFVMADDNIVDLIRDFEVGVDQIDVSAFAASIDDLGITNAVRRDGSTSWVRVEDGTGNTEFLLRFGDDTALASANLTADAFVFADAPIPVQFNEITGTIGRDNLRATGEADIFVLQDDDTIDLVRGFEKGTDQLDVSAFAASFDELTVTNRANTSGVTRWIEIRDDTGEAEVFFRFNADTALDAANLTADDFIFA